MMRITLRDQKIAECIREQAKVAYILIRINWAAHSRWSVRVMESLPRFKKRNAAKNGSE